MPSARAASLSEQRNAYKRYIGYKVGSLGSAAKTIARTNADAEMKTKISQYNEGLISNQDMLDYYTKALSSGLYTPSEKSDITKSIRNFNDKIKEEALQATFDAATGDAKVTAAKSMYQYYADKANTAQAGTPAQSTYLQKAAQWSETAKNQQEAIDKAARTTARYNTELELSKISQDSPENLQARSDKYMELAQEAANDGATNESLNYQTKAQNELNKISALQEKLNTEAKSKNRKEIIAALNQVKNDYHDGKISANQAAAYMKDIDEAATNNGDTSLWAQVNNFADKISEDIKNGVTLGDVEGLPTFKRNTANGVVTESIKEMKANFQKEDDDFANSLYAINQVPDVLTRLKETIKLYALYLNGGGQSADDPSGWIGLKNRQMAYQKMIEVNPKSQYAYENSIRDTESKFTKLQQTMGETLYRYQNLGGDINSLKQEVGDAISNLPVSVTGTPGANSQRGILITYDSLGREYQKDIPLNAEYQDTNPDGTTSLTQTYVGKNIAKMPDGTYMKLNPVYLSGNTQYADLLYGEYQGKLYVQDPMTGTLTEASQAAAADPGGIVGKWYNDNQALVQDVISRYVKNHPEGAPQNMLTSEGMNQPTRPDLIPAGTPLKNGGNITPDILGNVDLGNPAGLDIATPQKVELPKVDYTTPESAKGWGVGTDQVDLLNPVRITTPTKLEYPTYSLPALEQTPQTTKADVAKQNAQQSTLSLPSTTPNNIQTAVQNQGLNLGLDSSYGPDTTQNTSAGGNWLSNIGSGISNLLNKLKWW